MDQMALVYLAAAQALRAEQSLNELTIIRFYFALPRPSSHLVFVQIDFQSLELVRVVARRLPRFAKARGKGAEQCQET